ETAEQEAFDQQANQGHQYRRHHERTGESDVIRQLDGKISTERIKGAMREIDQAAQRKYEREPERDQQIICAGKQPVQDLLENRNKHRAKRCASGWLSRAARRSHYAGMVQLFSSRVGAMTSRL